jgi:threonine/homoserine/homoserine lactone efflux protein
MPQFIMLIGISVAIATAVHLMIVALAGEGHKWLSAPGRSANMQRIFAGLLVVIALWIFWRSR